LKAIVCTRYGSPDVLRFTEVERPVPRDDEALVEVYASSVNAADLEALRGDLVTRIAAPLRPMHRIPGTDIAGRVTAVGRNVKAFEPGDEIWGDLSFPLRNGAFAEYVCIPESALRRKPAAMTFEQAAATPTAGVVALQKLRSRGPLQPGQTVLINGAGGAVGMFAVQLARYFGAQVTAVDHTTKLDLLRALGAGEVIDYTQEDFTRRGPRYDLILDVVARRSILDYGRALRPAGVFCPVGGSMAVVLQGVLLAPLLWRGTGQKVLLGKWQPNDAQDLALLAELFQAGKVKPVIDRCYPLDEVPEALRYLASGQQRGKVVITVQRAGASHL
jgi:NADPH:quinone reductase-like Zn-dependent oxidoreductase